MMTRQADILDKVQEWFPDVTVHRLPSGALQELGERAQLEDWDTERTQREILALIERASLAQDTSSDDSLPA